MLTILGYFVIPKVQFQNKLFISKYYLLIPAIFFDIMPVWDFVSGEMIV